MDLIFDKYKKADREKVIKFMLQLYADDPGGKMMTPQKARATLKKLSRNPTLGKVQVIRKKRKVIGYCLLIHYWSNEYGGFLQFIDELFVRKKYRGKGVGTRFLEYLKKENTQAKALCLEVLPYNQRVLNLYNKLGFAEDGRKHLVWER